MKFLLIILFISSKTLCQNSKIGVVDFEYLVQNFPDGRHIDSVVLQLFERNHVQSIDKWSKTWFEVFYKACGDRYEVLTYDYADSLKTLEQEGEKMTQYFDSLEIEISKSLLWYKKTAIDKATNQYALEHQLDLILYKENTVLEKGENITTKILNLLSVDRHFIITELAVKFNLRYFR